MKKLISVVLILIVLVSSFGTNLVYADWYYESSKVNEYLGKTSLSKLKSKSALLYDMDTKELLYAKNIDEKLSIASLTKVMSMLLIMEALDTGKLKLKQKITASENAYLTEGSQVWLDVGEQFTVKELLESIAIHSANDSTVALAEAIAGSESAFVDMMNDKAKDFGMENTKFVDSMGLTDKKDGHFSTAEDLLKVSVELVTRYPKILDYTSIYRKLFREGPKQVWLDNTNRMIFHYKGTLGLKTGFTTDAGYNFICIAENSDKRLLTIVMGCEDTNLRFAETIKLLDHGFNDFKNEIINKKDEVVGTVEISESKLAEDEVVFKETVAVAKTKNSLKELSGDFSKKSGMFSAIKERSGEKDFVINIKAKEGLVAPVAKGEEVGEAQIMLGKKVIKTVPVYAANDVERANFLVRFWRWVLSWFGA